MEREESLMSGEEGKELMRYCMDEWNKGTTGRLSSSFRLPSGGQKWGLSPAL